ncbi:MAG: DUF4340 domain-containing protein [Myxococcaceae bacterium]|nr:DUF4340 domain-containing protein [Myxococcaceae bacterium]
MNKPTIAALAAFAVLLLAFFATREKEVSVGVQKFDPTPLSSSAIDAVTITGANAAKLERGANGWTVADPSKPDAKFAADEGQVTQTLTALAELKAPDFVNDQADRHAEYEVTTEKGTSVVATGGGKTFSVILGKASKSGGVYVRRPDANAVFSSPSSLGSLVKKNVTAWRKKAIATVPVADVSQVDVLRADGSGWSVKSAEGVWSLASPAPAGFRFDPAAAQRLVGSLTALTAKDFLSAEGDFSKAHVFTLTKKDGSPVKVTLSATKRDDGSFALKVDGDPQQYLVDSWLAEQLDKPLEGLRDLTLLAFDPSKVTKVTLTAAGKKTIVTKEGEAWKLVEPKAAPAGVEFDGAQVPVQLGRLKTLRAAKLVEKGALGAPSTTIELVHDGKPVKLVFGADTGSNSEVFVKGNADELVYAIAGAEKQAWSDGPKLFNKPPPPPDFGQMQGLEQLPPEIRRQLLEQLRNQQRN